MVDADRPKWVAIDRNERRMLSHREISSRSERLSVCLEDEFRPLARSPRRQKRTPGQIDARSHSSAPQPASDPRSQTVGLPSNKCDVAVSCPHSILDKRLECCADQLNPPPQSCHSITVQYSHRANSATIGFTHCLLP